MEKNASEGHFNLTHIMSTYLYSKSSGHVKGFRFLLDYTVNYFL